MLNDPFVFLYVFFLCYPLILSVSNHSLTPYNLFTSLSFSSSIAFYTSSSSRREIILVFPAAKRGKGSYNAL